MEFKSLAAVVCTSANPQSSASSNRICIVSGQKLTTPYIPDDSVLYMYACCLAHTYVPIRHDVRNAGMYMYFSMQLLFILCTCGIHVRELGWGGVYTSVIHLCRHVAPFLL